MTVTVLKTFIKKKGPRIIKYRCYKNYNERSFKHDLLNWFEMVDEEFINYDKFLDIFLKVLNKHAPLKHKTVRGNQSPFMTKELSKSMMLRSKLKNKHNKCPNDENLKIYRKQRNYCVNLLAKLKKKYYNNLDIKLFDNNITFWQQIKPLFSDEKSSTQNNITIIDNGIVYTEQKEVAEKLNNFFADAVDDLEIEPYVTDTSILSNNIPDIIERYSNHPSILKIKENVQLNDKFKFNDITSTQIKHEIDSINPKKSCIGNDIPAKILMSNSEIVCDHLAKIYNDSKNNQNYPISMKIADVIPVYKPNEKNEKVF